MIGYVDVHCHILPGIDDGAQNMDMTMQMVKKAYEEGIRIIIATPHYHPRRGKADTQVIEQMFDSVRDKIKTVYPDMELYRGNEIYYRHNTVEYLKQGKLFSMAGSDYVLVEFSLSGVEETEIIDAIKALEMAGYLPVIAHVERYENIVGDIEAVQEFVKAGAYIQVNAGSILGDSGGSARRFAKKLIKNDLVHFVGTDAHDVRRRAPLMKKCASYITKKFGGDTAQMLLVDHPTLLIHNELI